MRLFTAELRRILKSLIFWCITAVLIFSITSQIGDDNTEFKAPDPGKVSHGHFISEDPDYIFPNLVVDLKSSIDANRFVTYPYGFYRVRILKEDRLKALKEIISDLTSKPYEEIGNGIKLTPPSREKLESQLDKIDALIGGGSDYSRKAYKVQFGDKGMSYGEAVKDYNLMKKEGFDIAFSRYFSDYAGIFTLLITWFLGLYFWNKDLGKGISETLYVKNISSLKLIFTRVLALSSALMVIVFAIFTFYEAKLYKLHGTDLLNPYMTYFILFLWIFPIILFIQSMSAFLVLITGSILPGFSGPVFSLVYMMTSSRNIFYNIGYGLIARFNMVGNSYYFRENFFTFINGRILWIIIGLIITSVTGLLYERTRRGIYAFKIRTKV